MTLLQVIVVLYNSSEHVQDCFSALEKQSFNNFEVIVVDNNSTDNSLKLVEELYTTDYWKNRLKIISLKENTGFSGGNLAGYQICKSEYIAVLNIDTEVDERWLENLVTNINRNPGIGMCASKLIVYGKNIIDSAGDRFTKLLKGDKRGEGQEGNRNDAPGYVFGACAGAALYRKEMLDEIGFFDEDFFLIHEDTDLNFRAQLTGWKVMYVPDAIVHHKVRSSIGEMSEIAVYYSLRNSELVRIKNVPFGIFLRCLPWFLISEISEFIYFALKHKRFRLYFRAKKDALKLFPGMLKKRKEIMKNKKVSNQYIMSMMTPVWEKDFFLSKIRKFFRG